MTKKSKPVEEPTVEQKDETILIEFTVKKNGLGLEYITMENQRKGKITMLAETKRKSPFPPTSKLLNEVDRLRFFFAKACAMWHDSFDEFISSDFALIKLPNGSSDEKYESYEKAHNTIEAVHIEKVSYNGGYKIEALVETMEGKFTRMKTPKIDEEDAIFMDMETVMESVKSVVVEFIDDGKYDIHAESHDIVMRAIKNNEEELERLKNMTERDIFLNAIEQLQLKGALVMMDPELEQEIIAAKKEKELEEKAKEQQVDIPENIVQDESVQQFANNQGDHLEDGRKNNGKSSKEDDWSDTLMHKEEEVVQETVNEEFV